MSDGKEQDFFEKNWFEQRAIERKEKMRKQRRRDGIVLAVLLALLGGGLFALKSAAGEDEAPTGATTYIPNDPNDPLGEGGTVVTTPAPTSHGITQAQLDKLGDSIEARYESGDTEVAQALLDNFMNVHPECVPAVLAGGEGKMRDVLKESKAVAAYLEKTAPRPNTYTTIITVKQDDGTVKAAVLGVSCE